MWRHKVVDIAKDYKDMTFVIADETKMQSMFKVCTNSKISDVQYFWVML